jgi:ATP-binding protein involved in chromosome partitioning
VGVVDADLHGPTTARMLGASPGPLEVRDDGVVPARGIDGVHVMSSELLLDEPAPLRWKEPGGDGFVWRGTLETGMLREFLADVVWGALDILLVDLPPGTERLEALAALVPRLSGARRSIDVARAASIPILGIVENMSTYQCPHCRQHGPLFAGDAAQRLGEDASAPILDRIPFDPRLQSNAGSGVLYGGCEALAAAASALAARLES